MMYIEIKREVVMPFVKDHPTLTTEKSIALREIRRTDISRYVDICRVLAKDDFKEEFETVPLEYVYDLADNGPTPEETMFTTEINTAVNYAMLSLKPREERVLRRRFGIGVDIDTFAEIGRELRVTGTRIRDIETKALRKLECFLKKNKFEKSVA